MQIPDDWPVQPNPNGNATCGSCGLTWDDDKPTGMTPAPSGRCPFEPFHTTEHLIDVCVDCLMLEGTGEVYDENGIDIAAQHAERMDKQNPGTELFIGCPGYDWTNERHAHSDSEDCPWDEGGFSWSRCQGCGSTLGGDRFPALLVTQ